MPCVLLQSLQCPVIHNFLFTFIIGQAFVSMMCTIRFGIFQVSAAILVSLQARSSGMALIMSD